MTTPSESPPAARSNVRALHLLWIVPVGLFVTFCGAVWMTLNWCGVSGCSGGGFGRISDPSLGGVLGTAVVIAAVWAVPLALVPWTRSRGARLGAGLIVGVVVATLTMFASTTGFIR